MLTLERIEEFRAGLVSMTGNERDEVLELAILALCGENDRKLGADVRTEIMRSRNSRFNNHVAIREYAYDRIGVHTFGGDVLGAVADAIAAESSHDQGSSEPQP